MFSNTELEATRRKLADDLRPDTTFRTERTLLLKVINSPQPDMRALAMAVQLLSIRAGENPPADFDDLWPADLVELARKAAEQPAGPTVVNEW